MSKKKETRASEYQTDRADAGVVEQLESFGALRDWSLVVYGADKELLTNTGAFHTRNRLYVRREYAGHRGKVGPTPILGIAVQSGPPHDPHRSILVASSGTHCRQLAKQLLTS